MKKTAKRNSISAWLADERLPALIGRAAFLKIEALGWILEPGGRSLASIARQHGAKRQLLSRYARRVTEIYGIENKAQRKAKRATRQLSDLTFHHLQNENL